MNDDFNNNDTPNSASPNDDVDRISDSSNSDEVAKDSELQQQTSDNPTNVNDGEGDNNSDDSQTNIDVIEPLKTSDISMETIEEKFKNIQLTFVQKINELEEENVKLERQIKFYYSSHEKLLGLVDRQNYLNRLIKRITEEQKFSTRSLALKILKPIDWIEQTIKSVSEEERNNSWFKGLKIISNNFLTALAEENIKPIEICVGDEFDHTICDAVEQVESDEHSANAIVQIVVKGYLLHDRVLRHARVVVAKEKDENSLSTAK